MEAIYVILIMIALIFIGIIGLIISMYKQVPQGKALIKTGLGGIRISFNGIFIIPLLHKQEILDITTRTITINKTGADGLISKDGQKVDVKADFIIRINPTVESIERVMMTIGIDKANSSEEIEKMFVNKFIESLKTTSSKFEAATIHQHLPQFKMYVIEEIGIDLNGFVLDDLHIYHLEKN